MKNSKTIKCLLKGFYEEDESGGAKIYILGEPGDAFILSDKQKDKYVFQSGIGFLLTVFYFGLLRLIPEVVLVSKAQMGAAFLFFWTLVAIGSWCFNTPYKKLKAVPADNNGIKNQKTMAIFYYAAFLFLNFYAVYMSEMLKSGLFLGLFLFLFNVAIATFGLITFVRAKWSFVNLFAEKT